MDSHRSEYLNPLYESHDDYLQISVAPQCIRFWRGLYNQFEVGVHPRDSIDQVLVAKRNHVDALQDHIDYLKTVYHFHNIHVWL